MWKVKKNHLNTVASATHHIAKVIIQFRLLTFDLWPFLSSISPWINKNNNNNVNNNGKFASKQKLMKKSEAVIRNDDIILFSLARNTCSYLQIYMNEHFFLNDSPQNGSFRSHKSIISRIKEKKCLMFMWITLYNPR